MREESQVPVNDPWAGAGPSVSLNQVAALISKCCGFEVKLSADGNSFSSIPKQRAGIQSVSAEIVDNAVIHIHFEIIRTRGKARIPAGVLFNRLARLDEKCAIIKPPRKPADGETGLWVALKVQATPMSVTRESAFLAELEKLDELAIVIQQEIPALEIPQRLADLFAKLEEFTLEPVYPLDLIETRDEEILNWAQTTLDCLNGDVSVAIESAFPAAETYALAALAQAAAKLGRVLGIIGEPAINPKSVIELSRKVPGTIVIPAVRLSLGTNAYELNNEVQAMLSQLSLSGHPVFFAGTQEQLQSIFSGGQGGRNDPFHPVLRHVPASGIECLVEFAVRKAGKSHGGISKSVAKLLTEDILKALESHDSSEQRRILPIIAARTVRVWAEGQQDPLPMSDYVSAVSSMSETLAGLTSKSRSKRSAVVQNHFLKAFTDPELPSCLRERLLAQDFALDALVARLRMECLTRPLHQPLRYCAQGTPGTGKSESAVLLANRLDIPYINIDAASMPDYYTAAAQLLGSGRGIVGSYQQGRLEQAAKHFRGALIEISDLDHAPLSVRSVLADLFLQILETGEGQSAAGSMFSCANLIFAFTMNLPDGMDETCRKSIGFNQQLSRRDISARVAAEIKRMLSGAFLSRVGTPVIFDPLDGAALASILEQAIRKAIVSAAERTSLMIGDVSMEEGVGAAIVASLELNITSFGARALLEHGRMMAAEAFLELKGKHSSLRGKNLRVSPVSDGKLAINPE
ncbi:MAG: ATP-dependent Clp protease ATP-binding subunit [Acidobacteria bacterium]|nr:ATP-dependent Clp protease ATP-binding subunit [Acidobacteriota bacterium]